MRVGLLLLIGLLISVPAAKASTVACSTSGSVTINDATHAIDTTWNPGACTGTLEIPSGVTTIADYTLWNARITHVTIPSTVTSIGSSAFGATDLLTGITVDPANPTYSSDAFGTLFDKAQTTLIQYPLGRPETTYAIPSTVQTLGENSFFMAFNLTSMVIPTNVVTLQQAAFRDTHRLASVTFAAPSQLTAIGTDVFINATALTELTIPDSVTSIGTKAFWGATALTRVTLPRNPGFSTIQDETFRSATSLTRITVPSSVTAIGTHAFRGASQLLRIEFERETPPTVGASAFTGVAAGATAYRTANASGWGAGPWNGLALGTYLPAPIAVSAAAGAGSATVTVTGAAWGPSPDAFVISAIEDTARACTIRPPASSCTISGLATGASYTFTAVATTLSPALTSEASEPSNAVTPTTLAADVTTSGASTTSGVSPTTTPRVLPLRITSSSTSAAAITTTFTASGAGTAVQIATTSASRRISRTGSIKVCSAQAAVVVAGNTTLVCRLTNAARRARLNRDLRVSLTTTFTQQDGAQLTSTRLITLRRSAAPEALEAVSVTPSAVTG